MKSSLLEKAEDRQFSLKVFELLNRADLRLADNPGNIALAEHLMVNPNDPYLRELFDKVLEEQLTKFMTSGDPFWGNYPPKGALRLPRDNTILIGFMPTGEAFGIPIFEREGHVGIAGPTRQGKTNLLRVIIVQAVLKGCCVVAMTHKPNELSGLMTLPVLRGICRVLRWTELILALLEPPPGVPRLVWAVQVVDLIARCFGLLASRRLLLGSASNLYQKNAIEDLNLDRWARYVRGFETGRGLREEGYKESAWWVLETLRLSTGAEQSIFRYSRSNFLQKLFSKPGLTVIEGTGLPSEIFAFIVVYICRWLYLWRLFGGPKTPAVKLAIDDATSEVADTWRMSTVAGTSPLDELFTQMLAVAMEFYFCIHRFGSESELSRANTSSYLFCSARENLRAIREFAGLTEEQSDKFRVLQPGELIAFVPAFWPKPVYLRVPHVNPRLPTEQERKTARDDLLSGLTAVAPGETRSGGGEQTKAEKRQEQAQQDSGEGGRRSWARTAMKLLGFGSRAKAAEDLREEERRVLVIAASELGTGVLKVYERADLAPRKGRQILGRLAAKGLIVIHTFPGKGRGGRFSVIEVTEKGWERLEALGTQRQKPLTQGGWEHELVARLIGQEGKRQGYQVGYEVTIEDRRFDVVWSAKTGQKTFYEVELSDILHAVENLLKALEIPGVTMFGRNGIVLVVRDKNDAEKASKILAKKGRRLEEDGVISIKCVSDFIKINI